MKVRRRKAAGKKMVTYMKRRDGRNAVCAYCGKKLVLKDASWYTSSNPIVRFEPRQKKNGGWTEHYYHINCAASMRMPRKSGGV